MKDEALFYVEGGLSICVTDSGSMLKALVMVKPV